MILKIKIEDTIEVAGVPGEPGGWWIEDNIAKVHIVNIKLHEGVAPSADTVDCYLPHPDSHPKSPDGVENAIRLICRMKDGSERVIVFQGRAYLLNDEGKTIETMVG